MTYNSGDRVRYRRTPEITGTVVAVAVCPDGTEALFIKRTSGTYTVWNSAEVDRAGAVLVPVEVKYANKWVNDYERTRGTYFEEGVEEFFASLRDVLEKEGER